MSPPAPADDPRKILIVKPSALGDVITALPVLHALRRRFPGVHIAWLVNKALSGALAGEESLDEVIVFDRRGMSAAWKNAPLPEKPLRFHRAVKDLNNRLKDAQFDWALDLQGLFRSGYFTWSTGAPLRVGFRQAREMAGLFYNFKISAPLSLHTIDRNLKLAEALGLQPRAEDFRLHPSGAALEWLEEFLRLNGLTPGQYIVCNPATTWKTKEYPRGHWKEVIRSLSEDLPVVLTGGPEDFQLAADIASDLPGKVVNQAGQTDIPQYIATIACSRGVICPDSAAKFIAEATGVFSIVLHGPTRPERTGTWKRGADLQSPLSCSGCLKKHCPQCRCMDQIAPERVVSAAREHLL
ncbi:MAG: glycosyltransferase family 9 protein [Phycisphaerae bacterium]